MTATTIKVDSTVRDVLKAQAARRGRTLGEHLAALAGAEARSLRLERLTADVALHPVDAEYQAELHEWGSDAWN